MSSRPKKQTGAAQAENMAVSLQPDEYKVIIIGALSVGKTSMLLRYVHDMFEDRVSRFVSEEKKPVVVNGKEIILDIWDTAGQERFQSITNRFYQDTHAVLIIYDVTSEESFHDVDFWVREVQYYLPQELDDGMPVLFAGNKKDLIDKNYDPEQKMVSFRQVQEIANAYGFIKPIECSAKTGENVKKVFMTLATELLRRRKQHVTTIVPSTKHRCCLTS